MISDAHYTPPDLAKKLIGLVRRKKPNVIADFCAGNGALLEAAQEIWPRAKYIASDIDRDAISGLLHKHRDWIATAIDFSDQGNIAEYIKPIVKKLPIDLILLNPPFTCIGSKKHHIEFNGIKFTCSTALLFAVNALTLLRVKGILCAVLPQGIAYSERDYLLWSYLKNYYSLKIHFNNSRYVFEKCEPNILLATIIKEDPPKERIKISPLKNHGTLQYKIQRGAFSITRDVKKQNGQYRIVHSTNLKAYKITGLFYKTNQRKSEVIGPAILLPRVGTPRKDKIVYVKSRQKFIISDCIMAIKSTSHQRVDLSLLQQKILEHWDVFEDLYRGTGARFITINRLFGFLERIPIPQNLF